MVPKVEDNVLIAPIAISLATLVIVVISCMDGLPALHGRPPRTAHVAQSSDSDSQPPQTLSSYTSQGIPPTNSEYDAYLRYQAAKSASVAQTGNASACLTHTSSLRPWILDSGASDHISGNKDIFSSLTTTPTLATIYLS